MENLNNKYVIRSRKTDDVVDEFGDLATAKIALYGCEYEDKSNDVCEPNFYEVYIK